MKWVFSLHRRMPCRRLILLPSLLLLFSLVSVPATATVLEKFDIPGLTRMADRIVLGKVISSESVWVKEEKRIYTFTRIRVAESPKGGRIGEITVKQIGGKANGLKQLVLGDAAFFPGEEVLIFVTADSQYHYLVGMSQGKFSIRTDEKTGKKIAERDFGGASFMEREEGGKRGFRFADTPGDAIPLDELLSQVKGVLSSEETMRRVP